MERHNNQTLKNWGYLVLESFNRDSDITYLHTRLSTLDVISFTGYRLDKNGRLRIDNIKKEILKDIFLISREHRVDILPLISFYSRRDGQIFFSNSSAQKYAIKEISNLVISEDFSGIHLDFEYISPKYVHKLGLFLKEIRPMLKGKRLTMAIFPQVDFPKRWSDFHNLSIIGKHLDEIVLMCYDYHRPGTSPGPVVDLEWTDRNIRHTLNYISSTKIWLGVPAYGYIWCKYCKTRVISSRKGILEASKYNGIRHTSGTIFYKYKRGGRVYHVYFADKETRKQMKWIAKNYDLFGLALWRLGFEDDIIKDN